MYNLYSRNLKNYYLVQLGLLWSPLLYFSPIWSTGEISPVGSRVSKNRDPFGEIFFSPDALFRPRAYKNRASGEKISPVDQIGLNGTKVDWNKPEWTEVDLIGPNSNALILNVYKLYIILQVQNN